MPCFLRFFFSHLFSTPVKITEFYCPFCNFVHNAWHISDSNIKVVSIKLMDIRNGHLFMGSCGSSLNLFLDLWNRKYDNKNSKHNGHRVTFADWRVLQKSVVFEDIETIFWRVWLEWTKQLSMPLPIYCRLYFLSIIVSYSPLYEDCFKTLKSNYHLQLEPTGTSKLN